MWASLAWISGDRRPVRSTHTARCVEALRVPCLPPQEHLLAAGVSLRDPAAEVRPAALVHLARPVRALPLVVDDHGAGTQPV